MPIERSVFFSRAAPLDPGADLSARRAHHDPLQISIWEMDGNTRIGGGVVTPIPVPSERHLMPQTLVPTPQRRRSVAV
jgi:hypothetical protein